MLTTSQRVLRRFWYAVMPVEDLRDGPGPFRLMGKDIVLFLDADGTPAALADPVAIGRPGCRKAATTPATWCAAITAGPTTGPARWFPSRRRTPVPLCHVTRRPPIAARSAPAMPRWRSTNRWRRCSTSPKTAPPGWRRIMQFYEPCDLAPLRLMENSFDNAHFAFVHCATFGDMAQPKPRVYALEENDAGFFATTVVDVANPPAAHRRHTWPATVPA